MSQAGLSRRDFLEILAVAVAAGVAVVLDGCADTLRASLGQASVRATTGAGGVVPGAGWQKLASLSSLSGTPKEFPLETADGGSSVFAFVSGGKPYVVSSVCTHQGCAVAWKTSLSEFVCPCHGGTYTIQGKVVSGPPPAPLASYPTQVTSGTVYFQG